MKTRVIGTVVLVIVFLVFTLYIFGFLHIPVIATRYKIGDEIKGFPVDELSVTFANWSATNSISGFSPLTSDYVYIVIPVEVRNLADYTIYFNRQDDFHDKLTKAMSKHLYLVYGDENHEASPTSSYINNWKGLSTGWGINANNPAEVMSLTPNQSGEGFLCFTIGRYYNPKELTCLNENQQTIFTVDLNR
jgi:hypothetical protein